MGALILVGVVCTGGIASATLVFFKSDAVYTWSNSGAVISGQYSALSPAEITINAEALSTFTITATATNDSDVIWTGYILTLNPAEPATFVTGTGGSTKFKTVEYVDPWTIRFLAPESIGYGGVVTLQFDIKIPEPGPYKFTLSQNPIPEPATVLFLSLGTLAVMSVHKKKKHNLA
jgi:hypothetical protein